MKTQNYGINYLIKKYLSFALCTLSFALFWPSAAVAKSTTDISVVSVGARSLALGRAGVALIGSTNNTFVNPAAISYTKSFELTSMSTQLLGIVDYKYLGSTLKTGKGTLGLSYVGANSPAGYFTTDENSLSSATAINYGSSIMALSYGVKLNDLLKATSSLGEMSFGTNLKYHSQNFSGGVSSAGTGMSADLAFLYEASPSISWGVNFQNLLAGKINWATLTAEDFPFTTKVGGAFKLGEGKILIVLDGDFPQGKPSTLHGGCEWQPLEFFALRVGADQNALSATSTQTNLTAGLGVNLAGLQVDLAYRQDIALQENSNFYLSLSYSPSSSKIKEKAATKTEEQKRNKEINSTLNNRLPITDYQQMLNNKKHHNPSNDLMLKKQPLKKTKGKAKSSFDYHKTLSIKK